LTVTGRQPSLLVVADSLEGGIGGAVIGHCRLFAGHGWRVALGAPDAQVHAPDPVVAHDLAIPDGAVEIHRMLAAARHVRRLVRELRPDVVHAHGLRSLAVVLAAGRRPYVTLHSSDRTPGRTTKGTWVRDRFRDIAPRLVPGAFSVVPLERGRWTPVLLSSPRLPALEELDPEPGSRDPLFLFVSRLAPPKRPDLFVDAMAALSEHVPTARGVVLGDGPGRAALEARIQAAGAPVRVMGQVDDMPHWYGQAWGVCLFSDSEGLPFVVQEAMWAGRPLVTTDLKGVSWFAGDTVPHVSDASTAAEAMRELCDPTCRAARGRAVRDRARSMLADDLVYQTLARSYGVGPGTPGEASTRDGLATDAS
jgi:glycosyltransferase involved in cell wall biosynthesis